MAARAPAPHRDRSLRQWLPAVIEAIGRDDFEETTLTQLQRLLPLGGWAVHRLWSDKAPMLHMAATCDGSGDTPGSRSLSRSTSEPSFEAVLEECSGAARLGLPAGRRGGGALADDTIVHLRSGPPARLSMTRIEDEGSLLTVGLHHVRPEIPFDASHARRARALAPSLLACVARHLDWLDAQSVAAVRAVLRQRCAELTERELDVLERLLHGMTYDGIAADMGLSVSTVKTYRARAFRRLNIHFKNELFASLLPRSCHLFG